MTMERSGIGSTLDRLVVLFVREQSIYKAMGLDCYDRWRDARTFAGTGPVIAHPPCRTWGNFRHQIPKRPEEHALGPWAVKQVRRCGGVLEHPKGSALFEHCGCGAAGDVGFLLTVDQFHWGHRAKKPTRLYVVGCEPVDVPAMPHREGEPTHCISQGHGVRIGHPRFKSRVPQWEREATPPGFARWLVELARKCSKHNMRIYELRVDAVDCYYSLGLSASLDALKQQVEAMDGPDGGPVHEYAHGTEQLEIYARELGELQSDCAVPGVLVCSAKRYSYVSDDDKLKWRSKVTGIPPLPLTDLLGGGWSINHVG